MYSDSNCAANLALYFSSENLHFESLLLNAKQETLLRESVIALLAKSVRLTKTHKAESEAEQQNLYQFLEADFGL